MASVAAPASGEAAEVAKAVLSEVAGEGSEAGTLGQGTMPFEEEEPSPASTDPADSCLPPLPHDMFIASAWEDVARCSVAISKATPDRDPLRNCALVSEEEYLRMRHDRLGKLLETYKLEQVRLQGMLKQKRGILKDAVWSRVSRARLGGKAYSGWVPSEKGGGKAEARDDQGAGEEGAVLQVSSCISLDAEGSGVCGLPCVPMAQYCTAHVAEQPQQHLYKIDPATGNSVLRSGSIAQIQRLRKEVPGVQGSPAGSRSHKKLLEADLVPLSLNTNVSPGEGGGKLRTPDRLLAQSLAAVSGPFPPASSKEISREQLAIEGDDVSEEELVKLMRTIQDKRAHLLQAHQQAQKLHREQQHHQQATPAIPIAVIAAAGAAAAQPQ